MSSTMGNSTLVQKFNPGTGKLEWELQPENYDYVQEIARSGFADMLHDEERNLKYNLALQKAMKALKDEGKPTRVLDIGTGTGLLAMMAAKAKASCVTACETFQPMANCARSVIAHNGLSDQIKLIPKRSTDITVGEGKDMEERANVLITEVFDTELIGEGAIGTFNHANQHLLTEDSRVIPARGTVFVQLIESEVVSSWNRSKPIKVGDQFINPPDDVSNCPGNGAVHDIQLAQLDQTLFKVLSDPIPVFHFDWESKTPIPHDDKQTISFTPKSTGVVNGILLWWMLDMDREGEIVLSCAPPWAHRDGSKLPWRDHWMQAVYYLPSDFKIEWQEEKLELTAYHDEYSLWFGLGQIDVARPFCQCSVHNAVSRTRLGQLNDDGRNLKYVEALKKVVGAETVCMTLGDCCLLGLIVAKLGARKVYAVERNPHCRRVLQAWVDKNNLQDRISVLDDDDDFGKLKVNVVLSEPVFDSSVLPWHNLYFAQWKSKLEHLLADGVTTVLPGKAHVYAMAIEMKDLWKIRSPVYTTQAVDLQHFDKLIEDAIDATDSQVEPHPLWEYPCRALSSPIRLFTLDIKELSSSTVEVNGVENLATAGLLNGVALWMDWQLDDDTIVSGGPVSPTAFNRPVHWNMHSKQAVYFVKEPVFLSDNGALKLHYKLTFVPDTYEMMFHFSAEPI